MRRSNFFAFFVILLFAVSFSVYAGELININTADKAALETLSGIGPSKAQAIITYRTQNGPFAKIEDIMNVSGIGTATFNNIKNYITVGGSGSTAQTSTSSTQTQPAQTTTSGTQAQSQNQAAGAGPPALTVLVEVDGRVTAGAGSYFSAVAYGTQGEPILYNTRFIWNFGDGVVAEGARVFHVYAYPGRYAVSVTGSYNFSVGIDRVVVEAVGAAVSLEAPGDGSLLIRNKSSKEINIGLWSFVDGGKSYVIPEDTIILAGEGVRFAPAVTGLGGGPSAMLLYPNSMPAAAAEVSADSPLRGERIGAVVARTAGTAQKQAGEVLGSSTSAPAPADRDIPSPLLLSAGALVLLLAGGVAAAHYAGLSAKRRETNSGADEFDIEE